MIEFGYDRIPTCRQDGCVRTAQVSGYCRPHYYKKYNEIHTPKSTREGQPRITSEQTREIKRRSAGFQTNRQIAKAMGISEVTVAKHLKKKVSNG